MRRLNKLFSLEGFERSETFEQNPNGYDAANEQSDLTADEYQKTIYGGSELEAHKGDFNSENNHPKSKTSPPWQRDYKIHQKQRSKQNDVLGKKVKLGALITAFVLFVTTGFWAHTTGRLDVAKFQIKSSAEASLGSVGLTLQEFVLEGERRYTTKTQIRESLNASRGEPILGVEADVLRQRLLTLPWIKDAVVERILPSRIVVTLEERDPLAIWQFDGKQQLLDSDGAIIEISDLEPFSNLPLLVGNKANDHAAEFIKMIEGVDRLASQVAVAQFVNARRWTIKLHNGILIDLPEQNFGEALKRIATLDKTDSLLSRDVLGIDLRLGDRIILRTNSGAETDFRSGTEESGLGERT